MALLEAAADGEQHSTSNQHGYYARGRGRGANRGRSAQRGRHVNNSNSGGRHNGGNQRGRSVNRGRGGTVGGIIMLHVLNAESKGT
jgi:hypothetical protein